MKKITVSLIFLTIFTSLYSESLKVAAIQLEIHASTYRSYEQFKLEIENEVKEAVSIFNPDLILFPEYTSVFPAVTPYFDLIKPGESLVEIFNKINSRNPHIRSLKDLFLEEADNVDQFLTFWGELAEKYSVTIVGGSYFARNNEQLNNRLIVFGPTGNRIYEQDKYFLTDFETDIIGLAGGSGEKPEGLTINGKKVVFTICRDTFLDRWESFYNGADLWIDIKANGVAFTPDQRDLFTRALPARMKNTDVDRGVTVCLTGDFLELFWEGESSYVRKANDSVHTIITAEKINSNEQLYFIVE